MTAIHDEDGVERLGLAPSIALVLAGLVVAILPALTQLYLLVTH